MVLKDELIVQDEVNSSAPVDVQWQFHTKADVQIKKNGKLAVLSLEDKQIEVEILSDNGAHFEVTKAVPIAGTSIIQGSANDSIRRLALLKKAARRETICISFKDVGASSNYNSAPLSEWTK